MIELNIRGEASKQRRDGVLINFLTRRTPHTLAAAFVANSIAHKLDTADLQKVLHILGVGGTREALPEAIEAATPARAWVIVTAMIVAKHETFVGKSLWRNHTAATERCLHFLAEAAGRDFALVDVELAAAGNIDYLDIDLAALAPARSPCTGVAGGQFGQIPSRVCHEWNTVAHLTDYEGRPGRRPFSYN
ncbi:hypothetical protein [Nocardia sp. NBC_01009]|uniref:hypothetical protein n=1 Tax=Nocardia sp. NBC_01009 TaxID=2975996 RepID=UPI003868554E|nr:hypothetical protein OHA42_24115 [Nocardia sp. NBC_01009]